MSEDDQGSHSPGAQSDNWLGDLVKPGPKPEKHWLDGLVSSTDAQASADEEPQPRELEPTVGLEELPPHLKARLTETGEVIPPEKRDTKLPPLKADEGPREPEGTVGLEELPPHLKARLNDSGAVIPPERRDTKLPPAKPEAAAKPATKSDPPPSRPQPVKKPVADRERDEPKVIVKVRLKSKSVAQRLMIYRAIAVMMDAGVQLFSCFEFLAEQSEVEEVREACLRTAAELASGRSLAMVAMSEPVLFSETSARMLEVGMRSGKLVAVLTRLADDEQLQWEMRQRVWGKLFYPLTLALLALAAAILLPPLALSSLLEQMVSLTDDPPAITKFLLKMSSALSSPWAVGGTVMVCLLGFYLSSQPAVRERVRNWEHWLWLVPWIGDVPRVAYSCRFLQLFALTHDVGLPVTQCIRLSAEASGSRVIAGKAQMMVSGLMAGETLSEAISSANFLPSIAMESVEAGEQVAKVSGMMRKAAEILLAELDYRIDAAMKFVEPLLLSVLGIFVGVFALGCLLPILKLTESL